MWRKERAVTLMIADTWSIVDREDMQLENDGLMEEVWWINWYLQWKKKEVVSVWKAVRFLTALWPVFVLTPLWDKSCCGSYAMGLVWLSFGLSEWLFFAWPQVFFHLPATSPGPARAYTPGRPHHELHRWGWKKSRLDAIEDHKENHTAIAFV